MTRFSRWMVFILLLLVEQSFSQTPESLRQGIQEIVSGKKARVGVSVLGYTKYDTLSLRGKEHFPMQSVFKFHIALAVLAEVDKGTLHLGQKINIDQKDLLPNLYSPLREKYPTGGTLTLAEILEYTVSQSDNVGCDLLLRLLNGPSRVEHYFITQKFNDLAIKINEETMQGNWDLQYENWTTPQAAAKVLQAFYTNKPARLSAASYDFIWKAMKETSTGKNRLRGQLPAETVVAHKTGWSGTNAAGLTAAVNDIGVLVLPTGRPVFISVFVTDSYESLETNEKIIADISKATWDYFLTKKE